MTEKELYYKLCEVEPSINVFMQPFWMDAVAGAENWDVLLHSTKDEIDAVWVYHYEKKNGKLIIRHPVQTQIQGVWIRRDPTWTEEKRLTREKEIFSSLIDQLELKRICSLHQRFSVEMTNWLPFYWKGYKQQTQYTYRINDITRPEKVLESFNRAKRKNINKALKDGVQVKFDLSAEEFYKNHEMTLAAQGAKISYCFEVFKRMYDAAYKNNAGRTIYAQDQSGNIHAALFNIWHGDTAYDLISTIDPQYRNSGAATLLVYEMIKYLSDKVKIYDFEGSMIEGVENSFRQFGTMQTPYFAISKDNSSPFIKALKVLWHGRKHLFG